MSLDDGDPMRSPPPPPDSVEERALLLVLAQLLAGKESTIKRGGYVYLGLPGDGELMERVRTWLAAQP